MKSKGEIKQEIFELAQKISRASSVKFLLETSQEIYEKSILLKHAPSEDESPAPKQEEKSIVTEEIRSESETPSPAKKQVAVDLFSTESVSEVAPTPSAPPIAQPQQPAPKEVTKVNDKKPASTPKKEESVAEKLQHKKISDLKSVIGINEKFQFINELFDGNMKEYTVALDQINNFTTLEEATIYLTNVRAMYKWNSENPVAAQFTELVERKFI